MPQANYEEIIDFAIKREKEAVQFYTELEHIAHFASQKELLAEIRGMEEGHVKILENLKNKSLEVIKSHPAPKFSPSTYLVEAQPAADMTYQDILIIGMKREDRSHALYEELRQQTDNPKLIETFEMLAGEESKHKRFFEDLYDKYVQPDN
ncbi:MAG TPA: hypothetical protein ENN41_01005 [Sediminispirochaeta sp.]|nr:hypothetical protein [Sediminispirochaeta sp.]